MSRTSRLFHCAPDEVFDVLVDGWSYAIWVVGAARIRDVDDDWPAPGSKIHHSVGVWPLLIHDTTSVQTISRPSSLVLTVRAWPTGEGQVHFTCEPEGDGCRVTIEEDVTSGPAVALLKPVRDVLLGWRNAETLRRLSYLAESRARSVG